MTPRVTAVGRSIARNLEIASRPSRLGILLLYAALVPAAAAQGGILTETVRRVSISSSDSEGTMRSDAAVLSADGRFVAFDSLAPNLVSGDGNGDRDVFVRDRSLGITTCVSVSSAGVIGNADSFRPSISADGRFVAFESDASNLVSGDNNSKRDIFLHDRQTGTTTRISRSSAGAQANDTSFEASISGAGTRIVFHSLADNLVTGDQNGTSDVFLHDTTTNATTRLSVSLTGAEGNGFSSSAVISGNGMVVAFSSSADNLVSGDSNSIRDLFVRDLAQNSLFRASVHTNGTEANAISGVPGLDEDGSVIAFWSNASNLVNGDTNIVGDVFVRDRATATTTRVSVGPSNLQGNGQSGSAFGGRISLSADGRFVAFSSLANNFDGVDMNMALDVFVRDRVEGTTRRVSTDEMSAEGDLASLGASISADGRQVAFTSVATNLVPGDSNGESDAFVWDRGPWVDLGLPLAGSAGDPRLEGRGTFLPFSPASLDLTSAAAGAQAFLVLAFSSIPVNYAGGVVQAWPPQDILPTTVDAMGQVIIPFTFPGSSSPNMPFYFQYGIIDPGAAQGVALSNALLAIAP